MPLKKHYYTTKQKSRKCSKNKIFKNCMYKIALRSSFK